MEGRSVHFCTTHSPPLVAKLRYLSGFGRAIQNLDIPLWFISAWSAHDVAHFTSTGRIGIDILVPTICVDVGTGIFVRYEDDPTMYLCGFKLVPCSIGDVRVGILWLVWPLSHDAPGFQPGHAVRGHRRKLSQPIKAVGGTSKVPTST